ncbi:unnamed protein product [Cuscuta campestris]|uniref:Reverse transcriptase domain-containing protein n=1 Tax=Cuscuta campestris TaxID=132261 RepID=A0A484LQR5_9ASTE|nr:unnamed protein product [Cuscuta campestris]
MSEAKFKLFLHNKLPSWSSTDNFAMIDDGRMAVIWNPLFVTCTVLDVGDQFIHCRILCNVSQKCFHITFVFALYNVTVKRQLWETISDFAVNIKTPWAIMGDFNSVLNSSERLNCHTYAYDMTDLLHSRLNNDLIDAKSTCTHFTWNKENKWAKLDRVMVNCEWEALQWDCWAEFKPMEFQSDHCPVLLHLIQSSTNGPKPFKFFIMWLKHDSFDNTLKHVWDMRFNGTREFRLCRKLKLLKHPLKQLNNKDFAHISSRAEEARKSYTDLMDKLYKDPDNLELLQLVAITRKKASFYSDAKRSFFQQKVKCNFINEGDKCTKFFHAMVKKQSVLNAIPVLLTSQGTTTTSLEAIVEEFIRYYNQIFGNTVPTTLVDWNVFKEGPLIQHQDAIDLVRNVDRTEVKEALFSIGYDKALGTAAFFKKKWDIVGDTVFKAVSEFFLSGRLLKQINHALVVLIPKVRENPSAKDYRPIACSNVVYKIITKILSNRMARLLPSLLNPAQAASIKGRSIVDNILLVHHLVRGYARKRSPPCCTLKLDISKAYDKISWDFLRNTLQGIGFPPTFVKWVMECVTTASFSLSINGGLHGFIKCKRGIRQGDPMAPTLFLFCMEYLSRMIRRMLYGSRFTFHNRCSKLGITHVTFADDVMMFCKGNVDSVNVLAKAIKIFSQGTTTTSMEAIVEEFIGYYNQIFGNTVPTTPVDWNVFKEGPLIQHQDAIDLVRNVDRTEVKEALFSIGYDKALGPDGYTAAFFKKKWDIVGDTVFEAVSEFFLSGRLLKQINHALVVLIPKAASIKGRSIVDNILLVQHLVRGYARKRSPPCCMLKLDISKAYDKISWDFLRKTLQGIGFPPTFVKWVMVLGNEAWITQRKTKIYSPKLDSTQEQLMAPKYNNLPLALRPIKPFSNAHGPRMTLVFRLSQSLRQRIRDIVVCTYLANLNVPMCNDFSYDVITSNDVFGLLRASERDFAPLVNKVDEHIRKWNAKTLSAVGRLELIRSVIQGIEGFWFQAFPIHKSVLDRITSICRTFLWGSKFCKVAWEDICKPKDEGGLGLNQPIIWNQALLSKNLWNIASNKETLWVQWVHSVYLDGNDFWTWSPGKKDSHFFKKLIEIRDLLLLKCGDRWELENQLCDLGEISATKVSWLEIAPALSNLDRALTWLRRLGNNHCSRRKMTRLAILSTAYHIWILRNDVYFDNQTINIDAIVCKIKVGVFKIMNRHSNNAIASPDGGVSLRDTGSTAITFPPQGALTHSQNWPPKRKQFTYLSTAGQRESENLTQFLTQWKDEVDKVEEMDAKTVLSLQLNGLRAGELYKEFCRKPPATYQETYHTTWEFA